MKDNTFLMTILCFFSLLARCYHCKGNETVCGKDYLSVDDAYACPDVDEKGREIHCWVCI